MSIITLTSDFGNKDFQVSAIKGAIASLNQDAKVIDISHNISPHNLLETAYIIRNAYHHFPKGSVHILSIDSFYHKKRKNLVVKVNDHYFITADNGLVSLLFQQIKPEAIYEITLNNRFDDVVNFTTTDIFVPCAVHLQKGGLPDLIGRKINKLHTLQIPKIVNKDNRIIGKIIYIDHHENIVTNIHRSDFEDKIKNFSSFSIKVRLMNFNKIYENYTEIVSNWDNEKQYHGKAGFLFNQEDFLTFFIYKGYPCNGAKTLFGLSEMDKIQIEFKK